MTEDEIIELGIRSQALLTSKTFKFVVDHLSATYTNAILLAKPSERQTREENYYQHRALNDVVNTLAQFVAQKDELEVKLEEENDKE